MQSQISRTHIEIGIGWNKFASTLKQQKFLVLIFHQFCHFRKLHFANEEISIFAPHCLQHFYMFRYCFFMDISLPAIAQLNFFAHLFTVIYFFSWGSMEG